VDGERYTYLGRSLGLAQNDGDRWRLTLTMLGHRWWAATVGGGYSRAGGNTVTSPWQTGDTAHPDAGYNGYRHETSLRSDSVEQTIEFSGRGYVWLRDWADLSVGLTNRWVKNRNNRRTEGFDYDPALDVSLTLHYAGLYWVFREGERRQRRNVGAMRGTKVMDVGEGP
jgi:hypothetical protein